MNAKELGLQLAHPLVRPDPHGGYPYIDEGLTKREAFAMAAMQGMCASDEYADAELNVIAVNAVMQADALLAELAKEPTP